MRQGTPRPEGIISERRLPMATASKNKTKEVNAVLTLDEMSVVLAALSRSIERSAPPRTQAEASLVLALFSARDKILAALGTTQAELEAGVTPKHTKEASDE